MHLARTNNENRIIMNRVMDKIYFMKTRAFLKRKDKEEIMPVQVVNQFFSIE